MTSEDDDLELAKTRLGLVLRDKYRLERVLGVGGMAAVYAATHRNQKQFAVKVLHPEISRSADVRARFIREGYAANSASHPGAVAVLDDDTAEDGSAFLVMELLDGAPIETLWEKRGRRLPVGDVLAIAAQLLDVLAAAHAKGIVHRDIKPANLFLTRDGQVKVLDFGIARVRDAASHASHMTQTGALLGTPAFMPPEQALGNVNELDGQSDVWAVGATMFTLFVGRYVHDADTVQKLMILAATTQAPPLRSVVPDVHPLFAAVVDRALSFHKAQRFSNAMEMKVAAEEAFRAIFEQPLGPEALYGLAGREAKRATESFVAGATQLASVPPRYSAPPMASSPPMMGSSPPPGMVPGTIAAMSATRMDPSGPQKSRTMSVVLAVSLTIFVFACAGGIYALRRFRAIAADSVPQATTALVDTSSPSSSLSPVPPPTQLTGADSRPGVPPFASSPLASAPLASSGAIALPPSTSSASSPATTTKTATGQKAAARPKSAAKTKDCDPNFTLDSDGQKHFKPECFE